MHRVFRRGWDAPLKNPVQTRGAQETRGMGCRFFWVLFFGQAKKSTSAVGPRPDLKSCRVSDTKRTLRFMECTEPESEGA